MANKINATYASPWSNMVSSARGIMGQQIQDIPSVPKPVPQPKQTPVKEFLYGEISRVTGSCGIGVAYSFKHLKASDYPGYENTLSYNLEHNPGGCGFLTAAFIDNAACKEMYLLLKSKFPVLYQSPIRHNTNSGNNFFFCIFDTGENEGLISIREKEGYPHGFKNGLEW